MRVTGRALLDVPHEEAVVRLHQRVVVVGGARPRTSATSRASAGRGRGATPPGSQAGAAHLRCASRPRCRCARGRRPTFGAWYSSDSAQQIFSGSHAGMVTARVPPGLSTRVQLVEGADVVGDVLHHLAGDDAVEGVVGERQPGGVAADGSRPCPSGGASPASTMASNEGPHLDQLGRRTCRRPRRGRRGGRPRRRGGRSRSRGRAAGRRRAGRAGRSRRSASGRSPGGSRGWRWKRGAWPGAAGAAGLDVRRSRPAGPGSARRCRRRCGARSSGR